MGWPRLHPATALNDAEHARRACSETERRSGAYFVGKVAHEVNTHSAFATKPAHLPNSNESIKCGNQVVIITTYTSPR